MEFKNPTIIKLINGEDIIATIVEITKNRITVENPFIMETLLLLDQSGIPREEKILMKKWVNWVKESVISIPKNQIIDCLVPADKTVAHYIMVIKTGGIFRLTKSDKKELEAGNAFMNDLMNKIKTGEITPKMIEEGRISSEQYEHLEDKENDKENDKDTDFGNRQNDWSPDPKDYLL